MSTMNEYQRRLIKQTRDHCRDVIVKRKNVYNEDYITKRKRPSKPESPKATCLPGGGWVRASTPPPSPKTLLKQELADAKLEIQVLRSEVRWAGQRHDAVKKRVKNVYELAHAVDDDIKSLEKREALRAALDTKQDLVNYLDMPGYTDGTGGVELHELAIMYGRPSSDWEFIERLVELEKVYGRPLSDRKFYEKHLEDKVDNTDSDEPPAPPKLQSLKTWCRYCWTLLSATGTVGKYRKCPECGAKNVWKDGILMEMFETNNPPTHTM